MPVMKRLVLLFSLLAGANLAAMAQSPDNMRYCGHTAQQHALMQKNYLRQAEVDDAARQLELETATYHENRGGGQTIYIIPVVFHIIHNNGPENISDDQIYDAMFILNRDFRKQNADTTVIVNEFEDIAADIGIEFRLASLDPDGNCHSGINRVQSELTTEGGEQMKSLSIWPRDMYMNIWVCADAGDGTAGYTFLPSNVSGPWGADIDGIVLRHDYTGSIGTSNVGRSRTLTHETGHWLNLMHTWGPTNSPGDAQNCDWDDNVDDTPNTIGYTICDLDGASCGSEIDNVQNYMEYSYCSRMFTEGQRTRMRAALLSNVAERNSLITASNLLATGVTNPALCEAKFSIDRNVGCVGETFNFHDRSYHGVNNWTWDFGDGTIISGTDPEEMEDPAHVYSSAGTYTVTMTVSNGPTTLTETWTDLVTVFEYGQNTPPVEEGFEGAWPNNNWAWFNTNQDLTWEITPSASYSGDKSLKLRNYSNTSSENIDELLSATFDMSAMDTVFLAYRWSYANKNTETEDRLRISVSGDCGQTWSVRRTMTGFTNLPTGNATNSQFTPTLETQWGGETLILKNEEWMTDGFRVKFEFTGRGGNNLFLDDINISASDTTGNFVGINELTTSFVFGVYPNPTAGDATLRYFANQNELTTIRLYNALGELVEVINQSNLAPGEHIFTIAKKSPGLYSIVFEKGGQRSVTRVVFE
jgi:PKD repeat protein